MKRAWSKRKEILEGLPLRWLHLRKQIVHALQPRNGKPQQVVFVVGCQRSGTNLVMEIFENDWNACTYDEFSKLSSQDREHRIRLNPLADVKQQLARNHAGLVVLKPLVETQNVLRLLDYFPGSKAIFLYRHYRDVAASNLKHWGRQNGVNNLMPIVTGQTGNWRSENVPEAVRQTVLRLFRQDMKSYDAAALFWYVRNSFYFSLELARCPSVLLLKYEDLVTSPGLHVDRVYTFIGRQPLQQDSIPKIYTTSIKRGRDLDLSPEVENLCAEMLFNLDRAYQAQHFPEDGA